jgi:hypothetical protein
MFFFVIYFIRNLLNFYYLLLFLWPTKSRQGREWGEKLQRCGTGSRRVLPAPPYPVDISNPIASYIIYEEILNVHLIFIKHRNKTWSRKTKTIENTKEIVKWMFVILTVDIASNCPFSSMDPCGIDASAYMYLATSSQVLNPASKFRDIRQLHSRNKI